MKLVNTYALQVLVAALTLGACSPKNFSQKKAKPTELEKISNLFFNNSEIIKGEPLSPVHIVSSHVVALYDTFEGNLCTGSIIAEDIILTAGHCIPSDSANLVVLFGVDAQNFVEFRHAQFAGAHLDFLPKEKGSWADIGLVYFSGGLPKGYAPIQILKDEVLLQKGVPTELAGYGQYDGVKHTGSGLLRHTTVEVENPAFDFGEVELNQTKGTGACHGDSGGPAYIVEDSQIKLWGITSRGEKDPNNDCSKFSVYTNAVAYTGWIDSSLAAIHTAAEKLKETEKNATGSSALAEGEALPALKLASDLHLFR